MVAPQPSGVVEVHPTTNPAATPSDTSAANRPAPNPPVDVRPKARDMNPRMPQVSAPPVITSKAPKRPATVPNFQPDFFREIRADQSLFSASSLSMVSSREAIQNQGQPQMGTATCVLPMINGPLSAYSFQHNKTYHPNMYQVISKQARIFCG